MDAVGFRNVRYEKLALSRSLSGMAQFWPNYGQYLFLHIKVK